MLIQQPLFERRMSSNPIIFEAFWSGEDQCEVCEGFTLIVNWRNPDPRYVEVFHRLNYLIENNTLGIHLERRTNARKIHFGVAGTKCYDPEEHRIVISLAEIELHRENTQAFDWLIETFEDEEPEDQIYCAWPQMEVVSTTSPYEFAATIPDNRIYDELRTFCRAECTVRFFVPTVGQMTLAS